MSNDIDWSAFTARIFAPLKKSFTMRLDTENCCRLDLFKRQDSKVADVENGGSLKLADASAKVADETVVQSAFDML